jgi:Leucine-rich repeat (LRR) protein
LLTTMPSLEILDISRNKLKRLPSKPGSLTNLPVRAFLSLSQTHSNIFTEI